MLAAIVQRLARGDYGLRGRVPGVNPVPDSIREHIRAYVTDYGATLVELPEEAWATRRATDGNALARPCGSRLPTHRLLTRDGLTMADFVAFRDTRTGGFASRLPAA